MVCVDSADDFLPAHESSQFDLQRLEIDKGITLDHAVEIISTELGDGADCKLPKTVELHDALQGIARSTLTRWLADGNVV